MYIFEDFENKEQIKTLLSQCGMRFLQKRPEDQNFRSYFIFSSADARFVQFRL